MANDPMKNYRDNPLWDLIQTYMDDPKHRYPPLAADLARETGISEQVLSKWKARPAFPSPISLLAFAKGTGIDYQDLLQAALAGRRYLPGIGRVRVPRQAMRKVVERVDFVALVQEKGTTAADADYWSDIDDAASDHIAELQAEIEALRRELKHVMSDVPDTTEHLRAADKRETSISGEQAEPDLP